jgi:hypothetical protein
MKAPEHMKKLWTVSASAPAAFSIHRLALQISAFIPILNGSQPVDRERLFGVFPLRGVSC